MHDVPLVVPAQSANPWLVGTAFDYAFRFEIQRRNPAAEHGVWIAEEAISCLPRRIRAQGKAIVDRARRYVRRYAELGAPSERQRKVLSRHALRLARLDVVYRVRLLDEALDPPNLVEVAEVAKLLAVVPPGIGRNGRVILNPRFTESSPLSADADAFIGSALLDVKTWSAAVIERQTMRQLVGYLILARAALRAGHDVPNFDRLAIYFSRHAYLWESPIKPIVKHPTWDQTQRWFLSRATATLRERRARFRDLAARLSDEPLRPASERVRTRRRRSSRRR